MVVVVGLYREALDKEALGGGLVEVQCPDLEGARPLRYTLEQELVLAGVLVAKEVDLPAPGRDQETLLVVGQVGVPDVEYEGDARRQVLGKAESGDPVDSPSAKGVRCPKAADGSEVGDQPTAQGLVAHGEVPPGILAASQQQHY